MIDDPTQYLDPLPEGDVMADMRPRISTVLLTVAWIALVVLYVIVKP